MKASMQISNRWQRWGESRYLIQAILLGLLLTSSFAPYSFWLAAWLVPGIIFSRFYSLDGARFLGFVFIIFVTFYISSVYWIASTLLTFSGSRPISLLIWSLLVFFLAVIDSGFLYLWYCASKRYKRLAVLMFPWAWLAGSLLRSKLIGGFPWLWLAYSQTSSPFIVLAPFFGVYGLTLFMLYSSTLGMRYIKLYSQGKAVGSRGERGCCILAIILGMTMLYMPKWHQRQALDLGVVQANISLKQKWNPNYWADHLRQYLALSRPLKASGVIWPESALSGVWQVHGHALHDLAHSISKMQQHVMTGVLIKDKKNWYNAMVDLQHLDMRYDKIHLVPFGEFTPWSAWLKPIQDQLSMPMASLTSGMVSQRKFYIHGHQANIWICYDVGYTSWPQYNKQTAFLIVITDDVFFHSQTAIKQHQQIAAFRAAELDKALVFVNNNGLSAFIDHHGQVVKMLPYATMTGAVFHVPMHQGLTPIAHFYRWLKWL
jgi:apolipoprotein N-acyltransferase